MSTPGFNSAKCQQRNRVAAGRLGINAAPLRFRGASAAAGADGFTVVKGVGSLPTEPKAALKAINAGLPQGAPKLTLDDVHIHYLEAANSNFIGDRSMYLAPSTLQNIGKGGKLGVSFLNSHRSGGLSSPAELPFGQTFAGRFEEGFDKAGNPAQRAWLGVYLRRGIQPNGAGGPSTDDLHKMVLAGSIRDVSVGLAGGQSLCDVCGNPFKYYDDESYDEDGKKMCSHVPGTTRNMTANEITSAKARDARNKKGVASYSLFDAELSEISAVYDGAVPGAGVKQVLGLAKSGEMTRDELRATLQEAWQLYGPLLPFDLSEVVEIKGAKMEDEEIEEPDTDLDDEEQPDADEDEVEGEDGDELDEEDDDEDVVVVEVVDEDPETELARTRAELAQAKKQLSAATENVAKVAREKFDASMKFKIAPFARDNFNKLFAALQNGKATPEMLQTALANLPKNSKFKSVNADLSEVTPPAPAQTEAARRDEEDAKAFAAKQNGKGGK